LRDESGHAGLRFPPAPGRLSARRSGGSITYISLRSWSRPPRAHRPRPRPPSADEHLPTVDGRTGAHPAGRPRGPGCRGLSRRGRPGAAPLRSRNQRPLRCPRRANALTPAERERVPAALNSAEFIDTTRCRSTPPCSTEGCTSARCPACTGSWRSTPRPRAGADWPANPPGAVPVLITAAGRHQVHRETFAATRGAQPQPLT